MTREFNPNWEQADFLHWCHQDQDSIMAHGSIRSVMQMIRFSPFANPLLMESAQYGSTECKGYAILCEGALAIIGRIRSHTDFNAEQSTPLSDEELNTQESDATAHVLDRLAQRAMDAGAEIVQAICPILDDAIHTDSCKRTYQKGGMHYVTRLLQMECNDTLPVCATTPIEVRDTSELSVVPHTRLEWRTWCSLIEATYQQTRDVPELNGIRTTENTLRGYATGQSWPPDSWWAIQSNHRPIGCILLTPCSPHSAELTYVGLLPDVRGLGISHWIMSILRTWMLERQWTRLTLAVDQRNEPAIHLYQRYGFHETSQLDAWFRAPKPFST